MGACAKGPHLPSSEGKNHASSNSKRKAAPVMAQKIPCQDRLFLPYPLLQWYGAMWGPARTDVVSKLIVQLKAGEGVYIADRSCPPPHSVPMDLTASRHRFNSVLHDRCLHTSLFFLPTSTSPLSISYPPVFSSKVRSCVFHISLYSPCTCSLIGPQEVCCRDVTF